MIRTLLTVVVLGVLFLTGCGDSAQQLYETARLEEKQQNYEHAIQLYGQIVEQYPQSDAARNARQRLSIINKAGQQAKEPGPGAGE